MLRFSRSAGGCYNLADGDDPANEDIVHLCPDQMQTLLWWVEEGAPVSRIGEPDPPWDVEIGYSGGVTVITMYERSNVPDGGTWDGGWVPVRLTP